MKFKIVTEPFYEYRVLATMLSSTLLAIVLLVQAWALDTYVILLISPVLILGIWRKWDSKTYPCLLSLLSLICLIKIYLNFN